MTVPSDRYELIVTARANVIYHEWRERRFASCIRWAAFFSLIASSAATVSIITELAADWTRYLVAGLAFLIAILTAASLAFEWPSQMTAHARYKARWTNILVRAQLLEDADKESFGQLMQEVAQINSEEPPSQKGRLQKAQRDAESALA